MVGGGQVAASWRRAASPCRWMPGATNRDLTRGAASRRLLFFAPSAGPVQRLTEGASVARDGQSDDPPQSIESVSVTADYRLFIHMVNI